MAKSKIPVPKYYLNDISFKLLMKKRISHVLVVSSRYNYFMLEEDGRVDEQIFHEYSSLNLRHPPVFHHAGSINEMSMVLKTKTIDLIIMMIDTDQDEYISGSASLKENYADIPLILLTPHSRELIQDMLHTVIIQMYVILLTIPGGQW